MEILTVSQLTTAIKKNLEGSFTQVAVRGEVSNLRKQASGHIYFTLKDRGAQISAAVFRGNASGLSQLPKEGDQLVAKGELSVYAPRGNYQLIVRSIEFSGVGELLQKLHALKIKLKELGWFDKDFKKILPKLPKTIGVVTSPTGSVIQDILNILTRRFSGFHLILNPVRVQGAEAAAEIAQAICDFNTHKLADVLIIGRGGGSLEDLWPFNEEIVAEAIFNSKIPIISAVGHETDFTIADFVADVRAPTPSAAAELVIMEKSEQLNALTKTKTRIIQSIQGQLRSHRKMLDTLKKQPPLSSPYALLDHFSQKIDEMCENLNLSIQGRIVQYRLKLNASSRQKDLQRITQTKIAYKRERLLQLKEHLMAIDPRNLLKKGYSIVFREKKDSVILSTKVVELEDQVRIQLADGKLLVKVKEKYDTNI